jgi:hypothetical protein
LSSGAVLVTAIFHVLASSEAGLIWA